MSESLRTRLARCGCGALNVETRGEPKHVYLCACRKCQAHTGSAFSYAALFAERDVAISGAHQAWRNQGDSGGWVENHFCPVCGGTVFFYSDAFTGIVGVRAGCFAEHEDAARDPALKPSRVYWTERKCEWVRGPEGVEEVRRQ